MACGCHCWPDFQLPEYYIVPSSYNSFHIYATGTTVKYFYIGSVCTLKVPYCMSCVIITFWCKYSAINRSIYFMAYNVSIIINRVTGLCCFPCIESPIACSSQNCSHLMLSLDTVGSSLVSAWWTGCMTQLSPSYVYTHFPWKNIMYYVSVFTGNITSKQKCYHLDEIFFTGYHVIWLGQPVVKISSNDGISVSVKGLFITGD